MGMACGASGGMGWQGDGMRGQRRDGLAWGWHAGPAEGWAGRGMAWGAGAFCCLRWGSPPPDPPPFPLPPTPRCRAGMSEEEHPELAAVIRAQHKR